jgi:hypothetical protein
VPDAIFPTILLPLGNVGYATDLPKQARSLTHYERADNVIYEVGGQIRKFGGAEKINAQALTGAVTGMYDYWFGGGSLGFTQKFIATSANGKIWKDDGDGVFDDITGAATITNNAIPVFGTATNLLIIAFHTRNPILQWTGAGVVSALSSAPLGKGFVFHGNRGWIWDGSILYYSAYGDVTDWTGMDTGNFVIDAGDGDEIVGCASHTRSNLIVFKGPNTGSIHTISGTAPSGADAYVKDVVCRGLPLQSPHGLIQLGDGDLAFMTPRGLHLLSTVFQYGNFAPKDITRYLRRHFRELISRANMNATWGVDYKEKNCLLWATTTVGATRNDQMFGMSYTRLAEDNWKPFTVTRECYSMAIRKNPTTKIDEVVTGSADGFVRRQDINLRSLDGITPYTYNLTSPRLLIGTVDAAGKPRGDMPGVLESIYVRSESTGDYTLYGSFSRDNLPAETYGFALGETIGDFVLGTSILGVGRLGTNDAMEIAYSNPSAVGECRSLKFTLLQGGLDQDANLLEMGIEYTPAGQTRKSPVQSARDT